MLRLDRGTLRARYLLVGGWLGERPVANTLGMGVSRRRDSFCVQYLHACVLAYPRNGLGYSGCDGREAAVSVNGLKPEHVRHDMSAACSWSVRGDQSVPVAPNLLFIETVMRCAALQLARCGR
jgi:hypothetical protein